MEGTIKCKRCRWHFTEEEEYQQHLKDHILCKRCHLGFNQKDYQKHMKDHAYNEFKCPHCNKRFKPPNPQDVGIMYDDHIHTCKKALQYIQKTSTSSQSDPAVQKRPKQPDCCDEKSNKKSKNENDVLEAYIKPCVVTLTDISCMSIRNCEYTDTTVHDISDGAADTTSNGNTAVSNAVLSIHRCCCGGTFLSKDEYELHVEKEHTSPHCFECGITFKSVVAHALHSCRRASFTTTNNDELSSKNLPAKVENVTLDEFAQCEVSKLPETSTSLPAKHDSLVFNENCDIKPTVPSADLYSPLLKSVERNDVSFLNNKVKTICPSSHNKSSSESILQNTEFPLKVLPPSVAKAIYTTTGAVQKNHCTTLQGFCEEKPPVYTNKQERHSFEYKPTHHGQASFSTNLPCSGHYRKASFHTQMQHHQKNMYGPYSQWDKMEDGTKAQNMAHYVCYQCELGKTNFNTGLMTHNLSKPGNEALCFANASSSNQMGKTGCAYYPAHAHLPHLIPAQDKESGLKYHNTYMPQNLISGKQVETSVKSHNFPKILDKNNTLDTRSNICCINDIKTVRSFSHRLAKKVVNVIFPKDRNNCHATAVVNTHKKQSISHYNCEQCSTLFYTAESVIMHLQHEHHVNIENELRVFAL